MSNKIDRAVELVDKTINSLKDIYKSWGYDGILVDINRLNKVKSLLSDADQGREGEYIVDLSTLNSGLINLYNCPNKCGYRNIISRSVKCPNCKVKITWPNTEEKEG